MNFFFTLSYRTMIGRTLFGTRKVSLQIEEISLLSEKGRTLNLQQESIRELRKAISVFVETERHQAERIGEKTVFIGCNCGTEGLLLQQLVAGDIMDVATDYTELVNVMSDADFGLDSEYTIQKVKLPSHKYTLADKVEMLQSHPDFPKDKGVTGEISRCVWLQGVCEFDLLKLHIMSRKFHQVVSDKQEIINNEKYQP